MDVFLKAILLSVPFLMALLCIVSFFITEWQYAKENKPARKLKVEGNYVIIKDENDKEVTSFRVDKDIILNDRGATIILVDKHLTVKDEDDKVLFDMTL